MNRSELIKKIFCSNNNISIEMIEDISKHILDLMTDSLSNNERIEVRGFGSFSVRPLSGREVRNPKTGEIMQKDSSFRIHFKPGKELKQRIIEASSI